MRYLIGAGLLIAALPVAAILTIFFLPLWSWIEARFAIEAVGHSGPADWCYLLTYAVLVSALGAFALFRWRARR